MQLNQIYLSDLVLLRDVFCPDRNILAIFDPYHRLTGTHVADIQLLQEPQKEEQKTTFYVDLSINSSYSVKDQNAFYVGNSSNSPSEKFYFINNPDGTIRWLFPASDKDGGYLSLYNTGTWRGMLYKKLTHLALNVGQGHRLASGAIYLQQNLIDQVKQDYAIETNETVSFFTGTRGESRKVVMEIHKGKSCIGFIKIPLTDSSKQLVRNEINMLTSLAKYDFTSLSFPTLSKKIKGNARISNVKPGIIISANRITAIHAKALSELYNISHERKLILETSAWITITNNMEFLKQELIFTNGLNSNKVKRIIYLLKKLYNALPVSEEITVSVSHGDFTPWNMYCDDQRLYVYDWELAKNGIPMLFDLYHFTFQSKILQKQKGYNEVIKNKSHWQQTPLIKQIVQKYRINLELNFKLYLLFNISHYLRQYINEKELLVQSQWMIDSWLDALEETTHYVDNTNPS